VDLEKWRRNAERSISVNIARRRKMRAFVFEWRRMDDGHGVRREQDQQLDFTSTKQNHWLRNRKHMRQHPEIDEVRN